MGDRTAHTTWDGGMRAVTDVGRFSVVVDEPESAGGTDTGPQPTDLLLASITSCMALSIAWVAKKRGIELSGLEVTGVATYKGLRFDRVAISVSSDTPRDVVEELIPDAERLCYVSNTLRHQPELTVEVI
ncbi:MAG TPA: OsmC family protein [Nocardioidaceae bacterium]|nr:OsmC family protein [Nocardioidaceae bacterium]